MPVGFHLYSEESSTPAKVTSRGQLVTSPLDFSKFYLGEVLVDNNADNLIGPKANKQFVITDLLISGDRSIAANGAVTEIYEATSNSTAVVANSSATILKLEVAKQVNISLTNLNIITSPSRWINVKADDTIVRVNMGGYYVTI